MAERGLSPEGVQARDAPPLGAPAARGPQGGAWAPAERAHARAPAERAHAWTRSGGLGGQAHD
jgi:hypothetical protein